MYYFDTVNGYYLMTSREIDNEYLKSVSEEEYLSYLESLFEEEESAPAI